MNIIFYIILLLLCLIQTSKFSSLFIIKSIKPNFALIALIYYSFTQGAFKGQIVGFAIGMILDILISIESSMPLGIHSFVFTIIGLLSGFLRDKFYINNLLFIIILIFAASFFSESLIVILNIIFISSQENIQHIMKTIVAYSVYNALLSPIFFYALNKIFKFQKEIKDIIY